jgi:hypothetical protein
MRRTVTWFTGVALLVGAIAVQAQDGQLAVRPAPTFAVWTAFAGNEPLKTRIGHTDDRDLFLLGLRARWLLSANGPFEVAYTADLLPAVVSTGMPSYTFVNVPGPSCPPNQVCGLPIITEMTRKTVYGFGAVPLGGEVRYRATRPLALVLRGSAGGVYFSRPVPDPEERRLNFVFDVGAGAELRFSRRVAMTAGYRLNHISNAGRGPVNPGMNSHMLELGLDFAKVFW